MCYFNENANLKLDVVESIQRLTRTGKPFTGRDVYDGLWARPEEPAWQVSSYVRELFNKHHLVLAGYACCPLPDGPLMYFPLAETSEEVKEYAGEIIQKLEAEKQRAESEKASEEPEAEGAAEEDDIPF